MSDERIITGIEVTTGEAPDGKYLKELVKDTEQNGMEVKEILADAAYSGKDNLEFAKEEEIELISRLNPIISNVEDKNDGFEYNKDADTIVCPEGHLPIKQKKRKPGVDKKTGKYRNGSIIYTYEEEKCQGCPRREEYLKKGKTNKTYTKTILSDVHKDQKEFQETEEFKTRVKERYKIEAKNGELKNEHGLDRCRYIGLKNMRIQSFVTAFVANAKRINKLITTNGKEEYA